MARTTATKPEDDATEADVSEVRDSQDSRPVKAEDRKQETEAGTSDAEPGSTEQAKSEVIASDKGDHVSVPLPSGEGEELAGSVSEVSQGEDEDSIYVAQCALDAQTFEGKDQADVTEQLNVHYRAAHQIYDGAGLPS